jgi:hypothetical protein
VGASRAAAADLSALRGDRAAVFDDHILRRPSSGVFDHPNACGAGSRTVGGSAMAGARRDAAWQSVAGSLAVAVA